MAARFSATFASFISNNSSGCQRKCNWSKNSLGLLIYGRIPCTKKRRQFWMWIWRWQWKLAWSRARAQMMNWSLSALGCFIIKVSPRNAIHSFTLQLWSNNVSNLESHNRSTIWMVYRQLSGGNAEKNPRSFWSSSKRLFYIMWRAWSLIKRKQVFRFLKILTSKCIQKYCKKLFTEYRICLHTSVGMRNYTKNAMNRGCRPVNR